MNRRSSWYARRIYFPDIDDSYRIAEIILAPESCGDDDECDRDSIRLFTS